MSLLLYAQSATTSIGQYTPALGGNGNAPQAGATRFDLMVVRQKETPMSTLGTMYLNNMRMCFTLELPWKDNQTSVSRIMPGNYGTLLRYDKADKWRLQLKGVPGRSAIQMHIGNYPYNGIIPTDTTGCVLVGNSIGSDGESLSGSSAAYRDLRNKFYGSSDPLMTPNAKISFRIVEEFVKLYRAEITPGHWRDIVDGSPTNLQSISGAFEIYPSGKWRLTWSAYSITIPRTIHSFIFEVLDANGSQLFEINAISHKEFNSSTINFDSGVVMDGRIRSKWYLIHSVRLRTGRSSPD